MIENYQESESSSSSSSSSSSGSGCPPSADVNRTTSLTYTPDGAIATLTAINLSTGNQTTQYIYGTTLADSDVASSLLLRSVIYPDSVDASDQVDYSYNRQAQRTGLFDQNGSIHSYDHDLLGRVTQDRVTQLGAGVDGRVRRIEIGYEVRGLVQRISSVNNDTVGSGSVLNEVTFGYNDFGQSITAWQAHAGAVDTMTTPKVQNGYASGSANTIRPTSLTYPNGRVLDYEYGTSGGIDDSASRIASIVDDDATHLADYSYLGSGTVVQQDSPQADLRYTLVSLTGSNDPDTGDIYAGMDRFGRIKDLRWRNTSSNADLSRVEYGYDRASNRIWRENPTDPNRNYDWLYSYDGLHRLKEGERGTLNGTQTGITNPQFAQCWTLDETGNWQNFRQDEDGTGSWTLNQQRTANPVNEITAIHQTTGQAWATPKYDKNGNMTVIPRPESPHPDWANFTADQWDAFTADQWERFQAASHFRATYDAWNRLVKVTGAEGTVQENEYDGRGYRIITKIYADGTLGETRHAYFTDQWQCIEERLGTSSTPDRQFVWGVRYIDDLILRDRSTTGTLTESLYSLQDANWNITAVADANGTVQERYEYDPYGVTTVLAPNFTVRQTSNFSWETTYCGYRWDQASGLFAVRYRYYHAKLGGWLRRDPLGYIPATNLYEYVKGNPVLMFDPLGLEPPGYNHPYPLYLGGHNDQPLFWMDEAQHTAFHDYFRELFNTADVENFRGYGKGPRDHWKAMGETKQHKHLKNAMRRGGICDADIKKHFGAIIKDAAPGAKIKRVAGKGPKLGGPPVKKPPGFAKRAGSAIARTGRGFLIFIGVYSATSDFAEGAQGKGKHAGQKGVLPGLGNVAHKAVLGDVVEAGAEAGFKAGGRALGLDEGEGQTRCRRAKRQGVDPDIIKDLY